MGDIAFSEMLIIVLVIIILFGPKKLPQIARDLGQGVRKMRGAMEDIKTEILKETDNPVAEIKSEIDRVKNSITNFDHTTKTAPKTPAPAVEKKSASSAETPIPEEPIDQLSDQYTGPVSR